MHSIANSMLILFAASVIQGEGGKDDRSHDAQHPLPDRSPNMISLLYFIVVIIALQGM